MVTTLGECNEKHKKYEIKTHKYSVIRHKLWVKSGM